jgi:mono/diheme cytochrome c family protein
MLRGLDRKRRSLAGVMPMALVLVALGGCAIKHPTANLVHGKQLFVTKCGACHTLSHANTTGSIGPNLDVAFRQDRADGIKTTSIQGLVDNWILFPNQNAYSGAVMPTGLFKGQAAHAIRWRRPGPAATLGRT